MSTHYPLSTKHYRRGQGLLETIVALSVLVVGAVALLVLVIASSIARSLAEQQTVAANLGREAIEITRNVRDTNWIQGTAFDTGLYSVRDYTAALRFDPTTNVWSFLFSPNAITDNTTTLYRYTSGAHQGVITGSDTGLPAGTVALPFNRLLTLDPICANGTIVISGTSCADISSTKVGIRATATVQWTERGRTHVLNIEERLYDWR